jgi:hypothetical protein
LWLLPPIKKLADADDEDQAPGKDALRRGRE